MDSLSKWSAHLVDLRSLFAEWERRRLAGHAWTKRFREIHSVCMFTLCVENGSAQRYLIGFQQRGTGHSPVHISRLFEDNFGEIEDCDVLLVDDPKRVGESEVPHHRCQLVSYVNRPEVNEVDLVKFLDKKLRVARDDDLRLVIHVEQEGFFNYAFLAAYLDHKRPKCPYSQVFAFGRIGSDPNRWFCVQAYPQLAVFPELVEDSAKVLLRDRTQYSKLVSEDSGVVPAA